MTAVRRRAAVLLALVAVLAVGAGGFALGRGSAPDRRTTPGPAAVDVGFSQDMAVHHEQALYMAGLAPSRGGPAVRAIARTILVDQAPEVGLLRGWLRLWDEPSVADHPMSWMRASMDHDMATGSRAAMPGMASPAELRTLLSRSGRAFDVLFLQLMIRHHEGGIEMAQVAATHASLPVVRDAARAMVAAQVEDLGRMRALLLADHARPLPPP